MALFNRSSKPDATTQEMVTAAQDVNLYTAALDSARNRGDSVAAASLAVSLAEARTELEFTSRNNGPLRRQPAPKKP